MEKTCRNCLYNYEDADTRSGAFIIKKRFCGAAAEVLSRYKFPDDITPVLGDDAGKVSSCGHWEDLYD